MWQTEIETFVLKVLFNTLSIKFFAVFASVTLFSSTDEKTAKNLLFNAKKKKKK
jgi:hypothetical protein